MCLPQRTCPVLSGSVRMQECTPRCPFQPQSVANSFQPFTQPRNHGVIIGSGLSLTPHVQASSKSPQLCLQYLQNLPPSLPLPALTPASRLPSPTRLQGPPDCSLSFCCCPASSSPYTAERVILLNQKLGLVSFSFLIACQSLIQNKI